MLLDVWEWFLLINDGIDLVLSNLASGTYPIPFSFLLVIILFGLISFFAWRSTDIPDVPSAPRPPYVIHIVPARAAAGTSRQTISDVRLLSGGLFDRHEVIINRYRNLTRSHQGTNTERSSTPQPSTSSGEAAAAAPQVRNVEVRRPFIETNTNQNTGTGLPGRSFLLGLLGRPDAVVRTTTGAAGGISSALRAQLTSSPNVVVYHRVNVYHHHIHSHPPGQSPGTSGSSNITAQNPSTSHQSEESVSALSSFGTSSVPQDQSPSSSSSLPGASGTSSARETTPIGDETHGPATGDIHSQSNDAFDDSSGLSPEDVDTEDPIVRISVPSSTVQFVEDSLQNLNTSSSDPNPIPSSSTVHKTMPADSGSRGGDGGGGGSISQHKTSPPPVGGGVDVHFTIKFLNDTQMDVTSQLGEKIVDFKRRHFATEMSENKTVRLIFNGRVLDGENKTLRDFGIFDQCVVHCLIVNRQQHQDQSRSSSSSSASAAGRGSSGLQGDPIQGNMRRVGLPEPGMFFIAFIGIFLIFLWFICLHFGQHLFTQSAVVSLTVLTAIFLIGIVACYLPLPAN